MAASDYQSSKDKKKKKESDKKRKQRRERRAQRRDRNVLRQYKKKRPPVTAGDYLFRVSTLRGYGRNIPGKTVRRKIDDITEGISWTDDGPILHGSLTLRHEAHKRDHEIVQDGDVIRLDVRHAGKWKEVWRMRVWVPSESLSDGLVTLDLADDLQNLANSIGDHKYHKEKKGKHKNGWKLHEILKDLSQKYRFKLGKVVKTNRDIKDLTLLKRSPLDVLIKGAKLEREDSGKRYVIRWHEGKLTMKRLKRQPMLYALRDQIVEAIIGRDRGEKFFTAIELTANRDEAGSDKKKKLKVLVEDRDLIRQFGYILKQETVKKECDSNHELRKIGKRKLAVNARKRLLDTISITHPGIPFIRRGDAVKIRLPEYGFTRKKRPRRPFKGGTENILFVKTATHNISGGVYDMDLEFDWEDNVAAQEADIRDKRDAERRDKKRKSRKERANA